TVGAEIATELGEGVTHVGDGALAIVGDAFDQHRDAARRVAFEMQFLVDHAFEFTGGLLDRAFDVVLGHRRGDGLVHRAAQARIAVDVAAAGARGNHDLAHQLGEGLAALGVLRVLAAGNGRTTAHGALRRYRKWESLGKHGTTRHDQRGTQARSALRSRSPAPAHATRQAAWRRWGSARRSSDPARWWSWGTRSRRGSRRCRRSASPG